MASIGQRVFVAGGNDKYLSLETEELIYPFNVPVWTTLRLGLLLAVNSRNRPYTSPTGRAMGIGLCSGTQYTYAAATTTNFIGSSSQGRAFTYTTNTGNPYYAQQGLYAVRKLGTTETLALTGSTATNFVSALEGSIQRRSLFYMDITKASTTTFTVGLYASTTAQMTSDWSYTDFMEGLEVQGTPYVRNNAITGSTVQTLTCDELPGTFNTVDVLWNSRNAPLEIYAIALYRMN